MLPRKLRYLYTDKEEQNLKAKLLNYTVNEWQSNHRYKKKLFELPINS